jgi:Toxin SymE, type I toxin-antitoxin system
MAKPNDTRITHAPANASEPADSSTRLTPITTSTDIPTILAALLARYQAIKALPKPPRHARPPHIRSRRYVTVTAGTNPQTSFPWIRLCGHWLEHAGFALHKRVRVHVCKGFIILIPEDES